MKIAQPKARITAQATGGACSWADRCSIYYLSRRGKNDQITRVFLLFLLLQPLFFLTRPFLIFHTPLPLFLLLVLLFFIFCSSFCIMDQTRCSAPHSVLHPFATFHFLILANDPFDSNSGLVICTAEISSQFDNLTGWMGPSRHEFRQ